MFWNRKKQDREKKTEQLSQYHPIADTAAATKTSFHLPLNYLERLIPIGSLAKKELQQAPTTLSQYHPGEIIFNQGDSSDSLFYIVKGKCFLESKNGSGNEIDASTFKAFHPLSSDYQHQCTAIAKSDVSIIRFPLSLLEQSTHNTRNPLLNTTDIPENLSHSLFFNEFCQQFKTEQLQLPSLPDIALRLRAAVQQEIGVKEAVKIINLDPAIAAKLIQIVNSPLYRTINPISNCHDAITRLGLTTARTLVTSISMKNLFTSSNRNLQKRVHLLWQQSVRVSSISQTLATINKNINPDEALLAGLVHNIGALPVIIYADSLAENTYTEEDLTRSITALQGVLGNIILEKWTFPTNLKEIPTKTDNWYYQNSNKLELSDIVLLAKFHSYIGSKQMQKLPLIYTLPAFKKLGDNTLTPDMSLQALHDAKQQIAEAISLFG